MQPCDSKVGVLRNLEFEVEGSTLAQASAPRRQLGPAGIEDLVSDSFTQFPGACKGKVSTSAQVVDADPALDMDLLPGLVHASVVENEPPERLSIGLAAERAPVVSVFRHEGGVVSMPRDHDVGGRAERDDRQTVLRCDRIG